MNASDLSVGHGETLAQVYAEEGFPVLQVRPYLVGQGLAAGLMSCCNAAHKRMKIK